MTDSTFSYLSKMTHRPDAKQGVCIFPLGTIYWDDEMPQLVKISTEDHDQVFRLFAIRSKVWDEVPLSTGEKLLWDKARFRAPQWALFERLTLSAEEQESRENAERDCAQVIDELFASADHLTEAQIRAVLRKSLPRSGLTRNTKGLRRADHGGRLSVEE